MSNEEFSQGFDMAVNSYAVAPGFGNDDTFQALVFNEYEKSLWLTRAQKEIVKAIYTGKNPDGEAYEETEEKRRYLAPLNSEDTLVPITDSRFMPTGMGSTSNFFELPDDLMYITYESVHFTGGKCDGTDVMQVIPMTQDEYHRLRKNPFRGTGRRRAIRLDMSDNVVEVICDYVVSDYYLRYLRRPRPIILEDLPDDLTIDRLSSEMSCELPEELHGEILDRAVALAVQSKGYNRLESNS